MKHHFPCASKKKMQVLLLIPLLLALCCALVPVPTQLNYTVGTNYVYNVSGIVQNNGWDNNAQTYVPGFYSYMQAYMIMQPVQEDDTSYLFVMNLFGTVVSVSNTSGSGSPAQNNGESLGEDMYFTQLKTGEITEIQYYSDDSIYYVEVKLGAINAFQTSLVSVGAPQTVLESDPIGNHSSLISATGNNGYLTLTKTFSQMDFSAFPANFNIDPTVNAQNMDINAVTETLVHPTGYIVNSVLNQAVFMISGTPSSAKRSVTNSTGFDMNLSALGSLNVQFAPNDAFNVKTFAEKKSNYVSTNMFAVAAKTASFAKANAFTLNDPVATLVSKESVRLSTLMQIGKHYMYNSMDELSSLLANDHVLADHTIRDRLFFVLTVAKNEDFLLKYGLSSKNCDVVTRAVLAAAHFVPRSLALEQALLSISHQAQCPFAQASSSSVLGKNTKLDMVNASEFPFNKSYSGDAAYGGKTVSVDFSANVFAGTNLDCNNPSFNYEASAEASANVVLFGASEQAFDAKVVYGQQNGAPLADAITLTVWGNLVYSQALPVVPCEQGSYPLAHATPGFTVSHTLWVSIIPIVFSASAALDLTATWGWSVCPDQLTADVDISGDGEIAVTGSTYTDLLLLRAGFNLEGTFQTDIIPTASIQGTTCQVTFEVDGNNQPMIATVSSYYEWRHCKILFFDCEWGNHNQQTWWQWASAAKDYVLYKFTYQIGK